MKLFDAVVILRDDPEESVTKGMKGVVVMTYPHDSNDIEAISVEFVDEEGCGIGLVTAPISDFEMVMRP